jgi:alpha-L-rhamnosidase
MQTNDPVLQKIYDAAISTFAHNALDLYTDCPSRERAGWLCDSYFTAKAEHFFFGKNVLEEAFLENYRMYEYDGELPRGVLPMCYPSCIENNGKFIPQWNMWYILEVCEFLCERHTEADKELFRESVMGIINFLSSYENELGLLENLPSWNFVEWSAANNWVNDVNFPTNFLYAEVLSSAFTLYGDASMLDKAKKIRQASVSLSFNGEVFCDNAVRVNGILVPTKNTSEACQYYAALFGGIDVDKPEYAILKTYILNGFSGFEAAYPMRPFVPVNAFIGRYLRIMTLIKMKEYEILLDNIRSFFGGMSERTGTLWEYKQNKGSLDHGFASYAAAAISEALEALHSKSKI